MAYSITRSFNDHTSETRMEQEIDHIDVSGGSFLSAPPPTGRRAYPEATGVSPAVGGTGGRDGDLHEVCRRHRPPQAGAGSACLLRPSAGSWRMTRRGFVAVAVSATSSG